MAKEPAIYEYNDNKQSKEESSNDEQKKQEESSNKQTENNQQGQTNNNDTPSNDNKPKGENQEITSDENKTENKDKPSDENKTENKDKSSDENKTENKDKPSDENKTENKDKPSDENKDKSPELPDSDNKKSEPDEKSFFEKNPFEDFSFERTVIKITSPDNKQQFRAGDRIKIGATILKGSKFNWYDVYIKDSNNTTVYTKERNTNDYFRDVWDTGSILAGTYTVYVVSYITTFVEEARESKRFTLEAMPNINISVQENKGNGKIKVGGTYFHADYVTLDCINITEDIVLKKIKCEVDGKNWWYNNPVEGGDEYKFAVRAFNKADDEKWADLEVTAENQR